MHVEMLNAIVPTIKYATSFLKVISLAILTMAIMTNLITGAGKAECMGLEKAVAWIVLVPLLNHVETTVGILTEEPLEIVSRFALEAEILTISSSLIMQHNYAIFIPCDSGSTSITLLHTTPLKLTLKG